MATAKCALSTCRHREVNGPIEDKWIREKALVVSQQVSTLEDCIYIDIYISKTRFMYLYRISIRLTIILNT